jgi:radical SAM superfamily enzyme YgiQ (UPF0313 family)
MILLKEAGISFFDLGLQSGSENIRKNIFGRTDTNEMILKADEIIHKHGIKVGYDIIFSEFETEAEVEEGINFLLKLQKPFKVQRNKLAYYPNFKVTQMALEQNLITKDDIASMNDKVKSQVMNESMAAKQPLMNYYYFLEKMWIPNRLVKYMLKNKWHITHPGFLSKCGAMIERLETMKSSISGMLSLLKNGEYKYVYNRLFNKKEFVA